MQHPNEPNWHRWLRHAEEDLKYARVLQGEGGFYLTCYLAQQVAEKTLKAFLYFKGEEVILGHSIRQLADRLAEFDEALRQTAISCSILDTYYIPTRYPNGLPGGIGPDIYDNGAAEDALAFAHRVMQAVRERLP
jgi:HEPN domain-containing protein